MRWSHSLGKFFPILYWFEHIFLFWGITSNNTSSPFSHKHVLILSSLSYHNFHKWSVLYMHTNYNSSGPNVTWFFFLCLPKELPVMHYRKLKVLLLVMYHGHKKRLGNDKSWKINPLKFDRLDFSNHHFVMLIPRRLCSVLFSPCYKDRCYLSWSSSMMMTKHNVLLF